MAAANGRRNRLGKGLGALLNEHTGDPEVAGEVRQVVAGGIEANPYQPRTEFSREELGELAESIGENGLLQPIVVRPAPEGSAAVWQLVAGERRLRAIRALGWDEVPALVREVDDRTLLVLALVENVQRERLSPLEEAAAYQQLADEFGFSQQQIAEAVGRKRSTVANSLRLLRLPNAVREWVDAGKLAAGHARALLAVSDETEMVALARAAADEGWSVREVERRAKAEVSESTRKKRTKADVPEARKDPAARELERALQRALGTSARIREGRDGRGRFEIPFHGAEDFERLYERLTGRAVHDVI